MKLERTKNAKRNIIYGVILKIYQLLVPFALRTVLVYYLGIEYLGISSLFTSILSVLNLAELGVGSALVFSMYKPIAEDDTEKICALMKLYRTYYRIIGGVVLLMGVAITPALPYLVKNELPSDVNLYVLYYINIFATVLSYWMFAYKNSIFSAYQRTDVPSKINLVVNTVLYIAQFIVLVVFRNYYWYISSTLISQMIINVITAIFANKMFPQYKPRGNLEAKEIKAINGKVKDLFTARLGGVIINSADTVVISAFLGLRILAIYNNYFYVVSAIIGFATIGYSALTAGIGNSLVTENKEKNYRDFNTILYISMCATCVCTCCFINLFQPFMEVWMKKENMLGMGIVICLCLYFIVYELNAVLNLFKDAAGIWHQDRFRPLVVSLANLMLNIATVKIWGLYGVLLSTVLTMGLIGIPWVIINLYRNLYAGESILIFIKKIIIFLITILIICSISFIICNFAPYGVFGIVVRGLVSVGISVPMFIFCTVKMKERKDAFLLLGKVIKK